MIIAATPLAPVEGGVSCKAHETTVPSVDALAVDPTSPATPLALTPPTPTSPCDLASPASRLHLDEDFSLPEREGWLKKEGTLFALASPVYVHVAHGALTWQREAVGSPITKLVLQGARIISVPEELRVDIKAQAGSCTLLCATPLEHAEWVDTLVASSEWSFDEFYMRQNHIAHGASSNVYRAKRRRTGQAVALKSIRGDEQRPEEVRIMRWARHPHLMHALDVLEDHEALHIAQPLMGGGTLRSLMAKNGGRIGEADARHIMRAVLLGLQQLHLSGIVHRDVKPENIFFHEEQVKLGDFGLAALPDELNRRPTGVSGTPNYAAPEMFRGDPIGFYVDVWSCGVMAFEMMTGILPFIAPDVGQLRAKVKMSCFDISKMRLAGTSVAARSFVLHALIQNKDRRPNVDALLAHEWINAAA